MPLGPRQSGEVMIGSTGRTPHCDGAIPLKCARAEGNTTLRAAEALLRLDTASSQRSPMILWGGSFRSHLPGRRGPVAGALGGTRWRGPRGAQRPQFTERGFGVRAALGSYDRGHTAVSQLKPGDIDWDQVFGKPGARWFHTGGIFCALSPTTPEVTLKLCRQRGGTARSFLRPETTARPCGSPHGAKNKRRT